MPGKLSMRAKLLYAGGGMSLAFALFHCFFWELLNWAEELPRLSAANAAVMQMFNFNVIFRFLFQGGVSFILAKKHGPLSAVEKFVLAFIGGFCFLRAALGVPLFGVSAVEITIELLCTAMALMYLLALMSPQEDGARAGAA
jgi:hypothetical protein